MDSHHLFSIKQITVGLMFTQPWRAKSVGSFVYIYLDIVFKILGVQYKHHGL